MDACPWSRTATRRTPTWSGNDFDKMMITVPGEWDTDARLCLRATRPKAVHGAGRRGWHHDQRIGGQRREPADIPARDESRHRSTDQRAAALPHQGVCGRTRGQAFGRRRVCLPAQRHHCSFVLKAPGAEKYKVALHRAGLMAMRRGKAIRFSAHRRAGGKDQPCGGTLAHTIGIQASDGG
jgi:hypothetical protein